MIGDIIGSHAPALIIAIPLLAAFGAPLIGRFSSTARNIWVLAAMAITAAVAAILC